MWVPIVSNAKDIPVRGMFTGYERWRKRSESGAMNR